MAVILVFMTNCKSQSHLQLVMGRSWLAHPSELSDPYFKILIKPAKLYRASLLKLLILLVRNYQLKHSKKSFYGENLGLWIVFACNKHLRFFSEHQSVLKSSLAKSLRGLQNDKDPVCTVCSQVQENLHNCEIQFS